MFIIDFMFNKVLAYLKERKMLVAVFFIFFSIRLPLLDQVTLLHDERDIVLSGYSIAKTARDLFGNFLPISFNNISPNNPLFSIYYSAFWSFLIGAKSIFLARLPFVFISSFLVFTIYELIYHLTKNKKIALLTMLVFCFSPWVFHVTRLALDIPLAIVTLTTGMLMYIKKKYILSYLLLFATFFNYQGFRILIPMLIIYLELFNHLPKFSFTSFFKSNVKNVLFIFLLFASILLIDAKVSNNRVGEIVFFNSQKLTDDVNFKRNSSIAPHIVQVIFNNKLTSALNQIATNFTKGQDITYLFKEGDYSAINGNISTGQFFEFFLLFYYLGLLRLGKILNKTDIYICLFAFVGMITSLVSTSGSSFSIRALPSGIGFSFILANGLIFAYQIYRSIIDKKRILVSIAMIAAITISLSYFLYNYFLRRPVLVAELFNHNEKELSEFLMQRDDALTVYHPHPKETYLSYVFYGPSQPNINNVQKTLSQSKDHYKFKSSTFLICDNKANYLLLKNIVLAEACLSEKDYRSYEATNSSKIVKRIPYFDISKKTAYFVIE